MENKNRHEICMTNGPLIKNMLFFSIPLVLSGIIQILFNVADTAVIGQFAGKAAMASVGASSSIISLIVGGAVSLAMGTGVIMAHMLGRHDKESVYKTVYTTFIFSIVFGVLVSVVCIILAKRILAGIECPPEIIENAVLYLKIIFAGLPFIILYNAGTSITQAAGDTKHPLIYGVISGVANIAMNLIFVMLFKWNVAGVALATVISQIGCAFLIWRYIFMRNDIFGCSFSQPCFSISELREVLKIGLPASINSIVMALSVVIIQKAINSFGTTVISGNTIAGSIEGLMSVAIIGFSQSCMMFIGQNYGAGQFDRVRRVWMIGVLGGALCGELLGVILYSFSSVLLRIFTNDMDVIAVAVVRMKYMCLFYMLCVTMNVSECCAQGLKYAKAPMFVSIIGSCVVRITWIYTYAAAVGTLESIYVSYPICWTITTVGNLICFEVAMKKRKREFQTESALSK